MSAAVPTEPLGIRLCQDSATMSPSIVGLRSPGCYAAVVARIRRRRTLVGTPKWVSWAGLAAMLGGLTAIILTAPFATAYFAAYPGFESQPFWFPLLRPALGSTITFAPPEDVYNVYGRVFDLVYLLFLPAVFGLHHLHQGSSGRTERWGFGMLVVALPATFIGVAGDYWAQSIPESLFAVSWGIELLGLLTLMIGASVYGAALLRSSVIPSWSAWLLVACGPGVFVVFPLIGHVPSGPTFLFAVSWLVVGGMLLFKRGVPAERQAAG